MQDALTKVTGVSEVVSVSMAANKVVVNVEKGKVTTADLTEAIKGAGEAMGKSFSAEVAN